MSGFCIYAFDHEPGETCNHCHLPVDEWGNTEGDFLNCSFPECGCDGQRLCMAPSGASKDAKRCNVEGMYERGDARSIKARLETYGLSQERDNKKRRSEGL